MNHYAIAFFGGYFGASFGRLSEYDQKQSLLIAIGITLLVGFIHGLAYWHYTRNRK